MPRNFARHEQFLRIFALLEALSAARHPLDDQALIAALKDRLGLKELSIRTLHRDCEFLAACGYPLDHVPLPEGRRQGWLLNKDSLVARKIPAEPLTLLELVAFTIGRDLLRPFEGTVLWTGIESLRHKLERSLPAAMLERLEAARGVFHVAGDCPSRYASRPRLISALSTAITDRREIDVKAKTESGATSHHRLQPLRLVIEPPPRPAAGTGGRAGWRPARDHRPRPHRDRDAPRHLVRRPHGRPGRDDRPRDPPAVRPCRPA